MITSGEFLTPLRGSLFILCSIPMTCVMGYIPLAPCGAHAGVPLLFGLAQFFRCDPVVDARFEHVHRERARAEDFVVELAYVELVAKLSLRALAQLKDFQLTDLVAECLRGP